MNKLEQEIVGTIAEEGKVDKSAIKLDSNLYDLGIDSLSSLEILAALENKYDIIIAEDELKDINSAREIVRIVTENLIRRKR